MRRLEGLEVEVGGEGEPVLLVHGSHVAEAMRPLARESALADRHRLVRYHRRGFAGSDPRRAPPSVAAEARDAVALLAALGIERAHVVGHSYGAVVAIELALQAPRAVGSLVLLEPPLRPPGAPPGPGMLAPALERYRAGDAAGAVDAFMSMVGGPEWRAAVERRAPGGPAQAERDAATFFEAELPALQAWSFDAARAAGIGQPVLFLTGGESGPRFEAPGRFFASAVPQTEELTLPGLDHLLPLRDPARVAAATAAFLARHPL